MNKKSLIKLLANFKAKGVTVQLDGTGNNLSVRGNLKELSDADKNDIRKNKEFLVEFLKSQQKASQIESVPTQVGKGYTLSVNQENLWIESQFAGGGQVYNMPSSTELDASKNLDLMEKAVLATIERHEILRTVFKETNAGEVQQFVLTIDELNFSIPRVDLTKSQNPTEEAHAYIRKDAYEPFDLENGPLIRAAFLVMPNDKVIFYHNMHHIISDGWSAGVLLRDVMNYLSAFEKGENSATLPALRLQYKDFANWQREELKNGGFDAQKKYWLEKFEGDRSSLKLPQAKISGDRTKTFHGHKFTLMLSEDVSSKIQLYCAEKGGSLFMGLLASWNSILSIYSGQDDITVGSVLAGREFPELEDQIGFYVNTIVFRSLIEQNDSFDTIFDKAKQDTLEAHKHQMYPFSEILKDLNLQKDASSLFDVMFILENQSESSDISSNSEEEGIVDGGDCLAKFKLGITMWENHNRIGLDITFNTDVYEKDFIKNLITHYNVLLERFVEHAETPIGEIDFLSTKEKDTLLADAIGQDVTHRPDHTLIDLFNSQVRQTPEATAVLFEGRGLTYRELGSLSNQFANYLMNKYELLPNELISIKLERSEWIVVVILGILKTGSAYVPIDTAYPQERIDYIEQDAQCRIKIDEEELSRFKSAESSSEALNVEISPDNLAYIIYTSGSTGKPKGVMIQHFSACAMINWSIEEFAASDFDTTLFVTSYCFDLSIYEIFYTLLVGKKLRVLKDALEIEDYLHAGEKLLLNTVPSVVGKLLKEEVDLSSISVLNMAGEPIPPSYIAPLLEQCGEIRNLYGPSEDTTYSTCYRISNEGKILIGKPISNTAVYIINQCNNLLPDEVVGEVALTGAGLAKGYLNRPELTAEKFIDSPFIEGQRVYKTGDLARKLPDGNIEFIGRKDDQVKIRGYRIELGEIEYALSQIDAVKEAVVVVRDDRGEKYLVGYLTQHRALTTSEIRESLSDSLPRYMVPSVFVPLEAFPLSANGKIDKKKLPAPEGGNLPVGANYEAPTNHVETVLAEIWQETLQVERVGTTDNFFDLGGHSLIVGQIINKIYKQLNGKVSYADFFQEPTIKGISKIISEDHYFEIPQLPEMEQYELSRAQHRFWILNQIEEGNPAYNITVVLTFKGEINPSLFNRAMELMIEKHEILRSCFRVDDQNKVYQTVLKPEESRFKMAILDYREKSEEEILNYIETEQQHVFNFSDGPLIQSSLLQRDEDEHVFSFVMHHIIGDGWSIRLMMSEIISVYAQLLEDANFTVHPPKIQYKDYAHWANNLTTQPPYKKAEEYWLKKLEGELPPIDLPSFKKRPSVQTYNGDHVKMRYSKEFVAELTKYSQQNEVTLFMTLMAVINTLIWRYSGQKDILLGTPISSREHPDLEDQLGLYLNTLVVRTQLEEDFSFRDLVQAQKKVLLEAYHHQIYPFDELVSKLSLGRDASRPPLFNVLIALQSQNSVHSIVYGDESSLGFDVQEYKTERKTSQFDISFTFIETQLGLELEVIFNPDVYSKSLAEQFAAQFKTLSEEIAINDELQLSQISLQDKDTSILTGYAPYEEFDRAILAEHLPDLESCEKSTFCIVSESDVPQPGGVPGEICVKVDTDKSSFTDKKLFQLGKDKFVRSGVFGAIDGKNLHCIHTSKENAFELLERRISQNDGIVDCIIRQEETTVLYIVPQSEEQEKVLELIEHFKVHNSIAIDGIEFLDESSLDENGKISTSTFEGNSGTQLDEGELTELESKLLEFAGTLFVNKTLSKHTNFFEIGGNSMQIILLLMQVQKDYNVDIKPHHFFGNPTIAYLSSEIEKMELLKNDTDDTDKPLNKITI